MDRFSLTEVMESQNKAENTDRYRLVEEIISLQIDASFLEDIKCYLESRGLRYADTISDAIADRKTGKTFDFSAHLKGLIYALLSNQTPWNRIVPHLPMIDDLFFDYDSEKIKATEVFYFTDKVFEFRCGNKSTRAQMNSLHENIALLEKISMQYGSIDSFITSRSAYEIVRLLSSPSSKFKLKQIGEALAWEYLRNVGIDGAKPDLHLRRFFGSSRLGASRRDVATPAEVVFIVNQLSEKTRMQLATIDNLIWSYCAKNYGEICSASPKCHICVIKQFCKKG